MRRMLVFALAGLAACYNPDYSQKPCQDNSGCPTNYYCAAEKRCTIGMGTTNPSADLAPDTRPTRIEVLVSQTGSFWMGTGATDGFNDTPNYLRSIPVAYYLDEREVTVADYRACVTSQNCTAPATGPFGTQGWVCTYGAPGKDNHPVSCVTKTQAETFCKWMGRRLPTEQEWEFAALGTLGKDTGQRMVFAGALGGNACWNQASTGTCPVASFPSVKTYLGQMVSTDKPGFYDLLGNVWEKTSSQFCTYPNETCTTDKYTLRGGSAFESDLRFSKATSRVGTATTEEYYPNQGFRCARSM